MFAGSVSACRPCSPALFQPVDRVRRLCFSVPNDNNCRVHSRPSTIRSACALPAAVTPQPGVKPGPHRTRRRCSDPAHDRPSTSRPVLSLQNCPKRRWRRFCRDGTGRDALGRSQTGPEQRRRVRRGPGGTHLADKNCQLVGGGSRSARPAVNTAVLAPLRQRYTTREAPPSEPATSTGHHETRQTRTRSPTEQNTRKPDRPGHGV